MTLFDQLIQRADSAVRFLCPKCEVLCVTSPTDSPQLDYAVRLDDTCFWVVHRRRSYGPFDYQWSGDLDGIEFLYQGEKYGECCSSEEFFADLKPYGIPLRVSQVAVVVTGTITQCIFDGIRSPDRHQKIREHLGKSGLQRYELA